MKKGQRKDIIQLFIELIDNTLFQYPDVVHPFPSLASCASTAGMPAYTEIRSTPASCHCSCDVLTTHLQLLLCNRILLNFPNLQCISYWLEWNSNLFLLPIWHHPPLFEIKFKCQIELNYTKCKLEEMLKVRNIPQCSLLHKSMGILANLCKLISTKIGGVWYLSVRG